MHEPARRERGERERRRRRGHARARCRPGGAARRRRAQPALRHDGAVRLGVLDLRAAPQGRPARGRGADRGVPASRSGRRPLRVGLADEVLPGSPAAFEAAVVADAARLARRADYAQLLDAKRQALAADELRRPLEAYRIQELAEMSRDIFDDRNGFAAARHAFVTKQRSPAPVGPRRHASRGEPAVRRPLGRHRPRRLRRARSRPSALRSCQVPWALGFVTGAD